MIAIDTSVLFHSSSFCCDRYKIIILLYLISKAFVIRYAGDEHFVSSGKKRKFSVRMQNPLRISDMKHMIKELFGSNISNQTSIYEN